jgi:hypothetical protein
VLPKLKQGPGFPLTREGNKGFGETLLIMVVLVALGTFLGLDSVELGRFLEFLKGLESVPITLS